MRIRTQHLLIHYHLFIFETFISIHIQIKLCQVLGVAFLSFFWTLLKLNLELWENFRWKNILILFFCQIYCASANKESKQTKHVFIQDWPSFSVNVVGHDFNFTSFTFLALAHICPKSLAHLFSHILLFPFFQHF